MKRIILTCMATLLMALPVLSERRTVTETDSLNNVKRIIELRDTVLNGEAVTDTLSILTYVDDDATASEPDEADNSSNRMEISWEDTNPGEVLIAVIAIVMIFGLPVFIVAFILYFIFKNRRAKYRLAEKALEAGQPLPENFFKSATASIYNIRDKGVKNIFLGIGLSILLQALFDDFALACIGLLIMFTGFGQVVIYYLRKREENGPKEDRGEDNGEDGE